MKYVLLAIFVLFAAQPLQASWCDMCDGQGTTLDSHDGMHDGDMDHGDMSDMDCCDSDPAKPMDGCNSMSHCGACTAGVVTLDANMAAFVFTVASRQYLPDSGEPLSRFKSPPFRPPIA